MNNLIIKLAFIGRSNILMTIEKRNLLLFQSTEYGTEVSDELLSYPWEIHIANTLEQVSQLLDQHIFHVGLCLVDKCRFTACASFQCCRKEYFSTVKDLFNSNSSIKWIMGLPKGTTPDALQTSEEIKLIAEYCFDYITLPIDKESMLFTLGHAYGMSKVSQNFPKKINSFTSNFGIIGDSPAMMDLFKLLKKISKEDCSVLIQGETGTGKELIANAVHNHSSRSEHPLITINCGAFPKDLIQSELFGHEKGAFTGAVQRKIGRIEAAEGGTLFLDEIGDLPYEQQVNLLRFLEDRTIRRIGGSENIPVNVRIIAATHVDLKAAVQRKDFREDLFYRLQVLQIETPPLRERAKDIESLACYFFKKFSAGHSYQAKGFQIESLNLLNSYSWPGNVRELMNCIRSAIVTSENGLLTPEDLGLDRREKSRALQTLDEGRADADRDLILASLHHTGNNLSRSAELLGISRVSLYRLIDKHGIIV